MKKILITGATGLVGQEIVKQCHAKNIAVNYLSTSKGKLKSTPNYKGYYWNPEANEIDISCFEGVEVIINLAGASIAKRWTKSYKKEILESRLQSLNLLYNSIQKHNIPIKQLLSASAIGIYTDSNTNYYEETFNEFGSGFLAKVTTQWEAAALQFKQLSISVSLVRIGIVLAKEGGALPKLVIPIKNFLGAALGKGNQWQSWIHIEDLAKLFLHIVEHNLQGIFNGVAPNPVKQRELVKVIGKTINRPIVLPKVPSFVLKLLLGDMSAVVLESQRVSSQKVENFGFQFTYHHLQPALEDLL